MHRSDTFHRVPRPREAKWMSAVFVTFVLTFLAGMSPALAVSPPGNGQIAYMRFAEDGEHVALIEPDGSGAHDVALPQPGFHPTWSSDGSRLLVTVITPVTLRPMIVDPVAGTTTILDVPGAAPDLALLCRAWSPDDELILCQGDSASTEHPELNGIYSLRAADGSDLTRLTTGAFPPVFTERGTCGGGDMPGGFSPDGTRFVFTRAKCGSGPAPDRNQKAGLYIADADGGNLTQVAPFGVPWSHEDGIARWSPDGSRILFASAEGGIFTIRPDGSHMKQVTLEVSGSRSFAVAPDWSPDGSKIVFTLFLDEGSGIYTADADGNNLELLVPIGPDFVNEASWGPEAP